MCLNLLLCTQVGRFAARLRDGVLVSGETRRDTAAFAPKRIVSRSTTRKVATVLQDDDL